MLPFEIRQATESDADRIFDVHRDSVVRLCIGSYTAEQIRCWLDGRNASMYLAAIRRGDLWVAENNGLLGFVEVEGEELTKLFVHGERAQAGVGKSLLEKAVSEISTRGHARVYLESTTNARPFYERHGFTILGTGHFSHGNSGVALEITRMERKVPRV
ncbi:GNAT family N-acetyltransferase [Burkholderia sp. Ac-20353]|uniref:GNAT family N-acetyltransferase n=1 Tax=Burkholderia sp. Ac-20353 TaxID=2703894 RepID=UPI00197B9C82|nr:GNAT family N-acetyltransferase [Burkholderia sp. Ac-20353]MBN3789745.1 GNAT family N-acetyltransferase [Burkholderia sp. Ac-20353]